MQDVDRLRGGVRAGLWERDVARFGVPQWLSSADELKLLLMRSHNTKHADGLYFVQGGGVSGSARSRPRSTIRAGGTSYG